MTILFISGSWPLVIDNSMHEDHEDLSRIFSEFIFVVSSLETTFDASSIPLGFACRDVMWLE